MIPIDAVELLVPLGQLRPGRVEDLEVQPDLEAPLDGLGRGEADREHLPGDAADQDVEQAVEALAVGLGGPPVALPDDRGQKRLEDRPDIVRDIAHEVGESHARYPPGVQLTLARRYCTPRGFVRKS